MCQHLAVTLVGAHTTVALLSAMVLLAVGCSPTADDGPRAGPTPSPSGQPAASPEPRSEPSQTTAVYPGGVYGERLYLLVDAIQNDDPHCTVHLIVQGGRNEGIALSGCPDWDRPLHFVWVVLRNRGKRPLRIALERFRLVDSRGDVHEALYVGDRAKRARNHLPPSRSLRPGADLEGWVTFAAPPKAVPRQLVYALGGTEITIRFRGRQRRIPPGGVLGE